MPTPHAGERLELNYPSGPRSDRSKPPLHCGKVGKLNRPALVPVSIWRHDTRRLEDSKAGPCQKPLLSTDLPHGVWGGRLRGLRLGHDGCLVSWETVLAACDGVVFSSRLLVYIYIYINGRFETKHRKSRGHSWCCVCRRHRHPSDRAVPVSDESRNQKLNLHPSDHHGIPPHSHCCKPYRRRLVSAVDDKKRRRLRIPGAKLHIESFSLPRKSCSIASLSFSLAKSFIHSQQSLRQVFKDNKDNRRHGAD